MPPRSEVRFGVLGPLVATGPHGPLDLRGPRHRAVLARLLAAGGHVVPVDRLIHDLWDTPPPNALGALHTFVSALRRALEPDRPPRAPAHLLLTLAPGYALRPSPTAVDAHRFTTTITTLPTDLPTGASPAAGRLASADRAAEALVAVDEALALWRGPAYAEFADQPWARSEITRLDELRLLAIERRAAALLALDRPADAIPDLRAHADAHPWREHAWHLLALAQYRSARQADALATLRQARHALTDTLGLDPTPALTHLERDILHHSPTLDPAPLSHTAPTTTPPKETGTAHPPNAPYAIDAIDAIGVIGVIGPIGAGELVGRADELEVATAAAASVAEHGRPALVLISGEAGAGKTALAQATAGHLASRGWTTAWGTNPDSDGSPAGWPWHQILTTLAGTGDDSLVDGPVAGEGDPVVARFRWQRAVGAHLGKVAQERGPLLVVLDDLHWAGEETLTLLASLVTDPAPGPVLLLGTYRGTDVPPGLREFLGRVARVEPVRIQLTGLAVGAVAELAGTVTGRAIEPATAEVIHRRTAGNPFYVRELARLLGTDGAAALDEVPAGVRDVIRYRLAKLDAGVQDLLRYAATLGTTIDLDLLAAILDTTVRSILDTAEAAVRHGFLVERGPRRFEFAHALVRDTIYRDIPPSRRAAAHATTARVLETRQPPDIDALAHHYLLADDPATASAAARYAASAARRAERRAAPHEAARLWRAALTALDRSSPTTAATSADEPDARDVTRERLDLVMGLGRALALTGDLAGARELRAEALELAGRVGDLDLLAEAVGAFEVPAIWTDSDDPALASRIAELAERTLAAFPDGTPAGAGDGGPNRAERDADRVRLLATIALELRNTGGERGREAAREAVALARRLDEPGLLAFALNARFMQLFDRAGLAAERAEIGAELVGLASHHRLVTFEVLGHLILVQSAAATGDLATADRHATLADELGATYQLPLVGVLTQWYRALRTALTGDPAAAEAAYRTAAARLPGTGMSGLAAGLLPLALLCLRLRHGLPLDDLRDADFGPHEPWCRPLLLLTTGDHTSGVRGAADHATTDTAAAIPEAPRDLLFEARTCLHATVALALGDRVAMRRLYDALLPAERELAGAASGLVTLGPVAGYLAELAGALGEPERAAAHARVSATVAGRAALSS